MKKPRLIYPIIVEGKYDKIKIDSLFSATVITLGGFGVFNSKEKQALIRRIAASGVIVLVDSDGGGVQIRSYLNSILPKDKIFNLYSPEIAGKEKRKAAPSAEGTLGVEGMERELLYDLLAPFEDERAMALRAENPLCKTDLYLEGLTGAPDSSLRRDALCARLGLPSGMTSGALLAALRILVTYEEYLELIGRGEKK